MSTEKTLTMSNDDVVTLAELLHAEIRHYERLIIESSAHQLPAQSVPWHAQAQYLRDLSARILSADQAVQHQLPDLARATSFSFRTQRSGEEAA